MLRITFLGTGSSPGMPRKNHSDELCADARKGGKSMRLRSSALVETGDERILIDAGPDVLEQLEHARPKKLKAVLLTHGHGDAIGGIGSLDGWLNKPPQKAIVPIITDEATKKSLSIKYPNLKNLAVKSSLTFRRINEMKSKIVPFPVEHSRDERFPTRGYSFGKRLAYASDLCAIPAGSMDVLYGTDTLVLDGTMYFGHRMISHLSIEQAVDYARELKVKHLVLTQIGHSYRPHNEAQRAINAYLKKLRFKYPERVTLAYDGMIINFSS